MNRRDFFKAVPAAAASTYAGKEGEASGPIELPPTGTPAPKICKGDRVWAPGNFTRNILQCEAGFKGVIVQCTSHDRDGDVDFLDKGENGLVMILPDAYAHIDSTPIVGHKELHWYAFPRPGVEYADTVKLRRIH